MGEITKIQWCDATFNPWRGCTKVSAGCANCYAETLSKRNPGVLGVWGPNGTRVVASEAKWREPLKWDREAKTAGVRRRVFCASLADVFEDVGEKHVHDSAGNVLWEQRGRVVSAGQTKVNLAWGERPATLDDVRGQLWDLIDETQNLDWLLLTKRPENMEAMLPWTSAHAGMYRDRYWPNVWIGTSVENRAAKRRVDFLRDIPAAVRFLSVEPLLEGLGELDLTGINWVIFGGESGPAARPCDLAWIRDGVRQCRDAGVAAFVKQLGATPYDSVRRISIDGPGSHVVAMDFRDRKGGDPSEWPEDLRVREMPTTTVCV